MAKPKSMMPELTREEVLHAVRTGAREAVLQVISGGSGTPSADFLAAIQAGTEVAVRATRMREPPTEAPRVPDSAPSPATDDERSR